MSAKKPVLGWPSHTDAVVGLRAMGLSTRAIADRLGLKHASVTAFEHSAGRRRRKPAEAAGRAQARSPLAQPNRPAPAPAFARGERGAAEPPGRTVLFPLDVLAALRPHAARRGMHPNSLARAIVIAVLDDGLIDAVLDDGADGGG